MADTILPVPGVYAIRHIQSGRAYIGSSINMLLRWRGHCARLRNGNHHSQFLQRAWAKHGENAFSIETVEIVVNTSKLLKREQYWMQKERAMHGITYNMCHFAGSTRGRLHTEETKAKLKALRSTPEARAANTARQLGQPPSPERLAKHIATLQTPECKARLRAAHLGRKATPEAIEANRLGQMGRRHSEETKEKMRQSSLGRMHSDESKQKISETKMGKPHKQRTPEESLLLREKLSILRKGRAISASTKEKISIAFRERIACKAITMTPS